MSASGNSFSWNATDFGALGVYDTNAEEMFMPSQRMVATPLSAADGVVTHGRTFGARRFTIDAHLVATNRANRDSQMASVIDALMETASGEKLFSRDNIPGKTWETRLAGAPIIGQKSDADIKFTVEMIASNPWASGTPETLLQSISRTPQFFNFIGQGDQISEKSEPVWIFKNGAVEVSSVSLTYSQVSVGDPRVFTWANTLLANQWLRLTRKTGKAETSLDLGASYTTNNANMTGKIPLVVPGDDNLFTTQVFETGTVQVRYTPKFK